MDCKEFKQRYDDKVSLYDRLVKNVEGVIADLLGDADLSYLHLGHRVKSFDSAFEKMDRKKYADPFSEIEDFCGLRVICYYSSDVEDIVSILRDEFTVISEEDTQARLKPNEFGYRSTHLIVSIPEDWLRAPEYRGLGDIKVEIQVRTVLMHAWAEIQHKLAYKSVEQVPNDFQRMLFRLSAKFEEADEQLEQIRHGLRDYRSSIQPIVKSDFASLTGQPFNLDTLTILLDAAYPERDKSMSQNADLLAEVMFFSMTLEDLISAIKKQARFIGQLDDHHCGGDPSRKWAQVGALRNALDISNDTYYMLRLPDYEESEGWAENTEFGRQLLASEPA